jgi:hypothetical protein
MTDEQLFETLRRLDAPAMPDPRFEDALRRRTYAMVAATTKGSTLRRPWLMAAAAAIAVIALVGAFTLRTERGYSQGQPGGIPSTSATASPSPSNPNDASLAFDRPFRFRVPEGVHLNVNSNFMPLALELIDGPVYERGQYGSDGNGMPSGVRGIEVASLRSVTTHSCSVATGASMRVPVRDRQPAFLDDLGRLGGMTFASPVSMTVGSRHAISTYLAAKKCEGADFHVTTGAYVDLNVPSRLILVDFDGPAFAIQIWATTEDELSAWLPTAQTIIDSIEFVEPSPVIGCGRIKATDCQKSIDLVRSQTRSDLSQVIRIVVDDVCSPEVICDRRWPFDAIVVLSGPVERSGDAGQVALHAYEAVGASGPETATPFSGEIPTHIKSGLSAP